MSGHIGIFSKDDLEVAPLLYVGLYALQHRGEVGSGMAVYNQGKFSEHRGKGLVSDVYSEEKLIETKGSMGAAHVKYAFSHETEENVLLPEIFQYQEEPRLISIDGNFLEKTLSREFFIPLFNDLSTVAEKIGNIKGAYSIIYIDKDKMIAVRDPWGIKNICLGKYDDSYVVASETCAIDAIGAEFVRDLEPGEILIIENDKLTSLKTNRPKTKNCIFEFVYISRQDSFINDRSVYGVRYNLGRRLAEEAPVNADVVIGAPDSGTIASLGFSHESRIQYKEGILKNRYVGRTFLLADQNMREKSIRLKMNPLKTNLNGKRVILVDDSIVRGNTIKTTVQTLKDSGAQEVHVRIACPPVIKSCDLCVDTPEEKYLIGANLSVEETRKFIGADSLAYLSLESMVEICGGKNYCTNCFDGIYPIEVENGDNI